MKRALSYREWLDLIDSIESRLAQAIHVNKELRRRNAIGGERGYPANSMGTVKSNEITDRTGTLAVSPPENDPVRDAQLNIEKALLKFDKEINVPLSNALTLPDMHRIKMQAMGAHYAKLERRARDRQRQAIHRSKGEK